MNDETKWQAGDDFPAEADGFPTWGIDRVHQGRKHGNAIEVYTSAEDRDAIVAALNRAVADEKQAPVPVGWVRLTLMGLEENQPWLVPVGILKKMWGVSYDRMAHPPGMGTRAEFRQWTLVETWAEVAALIAEAERAERRARALPAMAAEICSGALVDTRTLTELAKPGDGSTHADVLAQLAVVMAGRILDAIEARGDDG